MGMVPPQLLQGSFQSPTRPPPVRRGATDDRWLPWDDDVYADGSVTIVARNSRFPLDADDHPRSSVATDGHARQQGMTTLECRTAQK